MIEGLTNYLLGGEFLNKYRYRLQRPSASSSVTIHHIPARHIQNRLNVKPSCVNLIDTCGFSTNPDTDNIDSMMLIRALFTNLSSIDQLFYCINPKSQGLPKYRQWFQNQVMSLYSRDLNDRVSELITFTDDPSSLMLDDTKFRFDNTVMFSSKTEDFGLFKLVTDNYFNLAAHITSTVKKASSLN